MTFIEIGTIFAVTNIKNHVENQNNKNMYLTLFNKK